MRYAKILSVFLLMLLAFTLVSCGGGSSKEPGPTTTIPATQPQTTPSPSTTPPATTVPPVTTPAAPAEIDLVESGYVIVYNKQNTSDGRLKALLWAQLKQSGISFSSFDQTTAPLEREILLTNVSDRSESAAFFGEMSPKTSEHIGAYAILFDGQKLIVAASCREAELLVAEKLVSYVSGGKLILPADLYDVTYFDLGVYKSTDRVVSIDGDKILSMTDLVSLSVPGNSAVALEAGKYSYDVPYDPTLPNPTVEDIEATLYHPSMKCDVSLSGTVATLSVTSIDGSVTKEYKVNFKMQDQFQISAEIVNKNGAEGVLTLISDDGDQRTSDFFYTEIVPNYSSFKITIAMPTKKIASLTKTADGSAWLMDSDGKYQLSILPNTYNSAVPGSIFKSGNHATMVDFWKQIVSCDAIVLASHSHTHAAWGVTDEQNGKYPAGNVIKELHASAQILRDLLGQDTPFILRPGGHDDLSSPYFYSLVASDNTFIGMRTSNGAPPLIGASSTKLNTVSKFQKPDERLKIATILVRSYEAAFNGDGSGFATDSTSSIEERLNAGISAWTHYVDLAMENNSWASIGFHSVGADTSNVSGYTVFDSQVKALMDYVQPLVESGRLWLPTFAEAAKYYFQWSSATLSSVCYRDERIEIRLDDQEEDPRFDEKLTVKVTVPYAWSSVKLDTNGASETLTVHTAEDGTHFVYANILPGTGVSTLTPINN